MFSLIKKNNRGFSLAEVMVAGGLISVISLVVLDIVKSTKNAESLSSINQEVNIVTMDISRILQNQENCTLSLENLNPTGLFPAGATVDAIRRVVSGVQTDAYTRGEILNRQAGGNAASLQIENITLSNYNNRTDPLYQAANRQAFMTISYKVSYAIGVDLESLTPTELNELRIRIGTTPRIIKRFPVQVDLNETNNIIRCSAIGSWSQFAEQTCQSQLGGTFIDGKCVNIIAQSVTNTTSLTPFGNSMVAADGDVQTDGRWKTTNLKVDDNPINSNLDAGLNFQSDHLWANALGLAGHNVTASGSVSTPGSIYIGDQYTNAGATSTLGTGSNPQGLESEGQIRIAGSATLTGFPPTGGLSSSSNDDNAYIVTAQWASERLASIFSTDGTTFNDLVNGILGNPATAQSRAANIIRAFVCQNTYLRTLPADSGNYQNPLTTLPNYPSPVRGRYEAGNCIFDQVMPRNCTNAAGGCNNVQLTQALCIDKVCKSRWPYIKTTAACTWRNACNINERPRASRTITPTFLCCGWTTEAGPAY